MVMLMEEKESRFLATERFLHSLGIAEYKGKAVRIQTVLNKKFCVEREYITVVVDSANLARRWPEQHFSILIDQLLIRYKWDVYLLGVRARDEMKDVLEGLKVKHPGRLHDMVGKTSFNDWVTAIRDSKFLVGVDSGAVHVAAALGTQAFCLSGVWQGYNFFPYPPQVLCEGIVSPICIYMPGSEEAPCFNCTGKTGKYGTLNSKCHESYKKNEPCLCLQNIRPEQVLAAIEKTFPPAGDKKSDKEVQL